MSKEKIRHAIGIYCGSESDAEALYSDIIKILSEQQNYCNVCGKAIGNQCRECDDLFNKYEPITQKIFPMCIEMENASSDHAKQQMLKALETFEKMIPTEYQAKYTEAKKIVEKFDAAYRGLDEK